MCHGPLVGRLRVFALSLVSRRTEPSLRKVGALRQPCTPAQSTKVIQRVRPNDDV
jgi:hypothetical protein